MLKRNIKKIVLYMFVMLVALVSLFPFYWMFVMGTRSSAEIFRFPPVIAPGKMLVDNAIALFNTINFPKAILNSMIVSTLKTVSALFFCSMVAFYFAKFDFVGKKFLYSFILITMMIPTQLLMIPQLIMMGKLGWISSLKALIIPSMIPAFGIFWMTQYNQNAIHDDLLNAARIDGCGIFRLYRVIGLPLAIPGLAFLAIYTFLYTWNDFIWPLIVLNDESVFTVQVALGQLQGMYTKTDYGAVMFGTLLASLPIIAIFLFCNKLFIAGISEGGVKD